MTETEQIPDTYENELNLAPGARASRRATRIYLVRHAEVAAEHRNTYYGQMDVPLSDRGFQQSQETAERLSSVPFDAIYASDLSRAGYLADLLAEPLGLPVRRLEIFRERHMGVLQGIDIDELKRGAHSHSTTFARWEGDRIRFRVPEGENFEDLHNRVVPGLEEISLAFKGRRVAVVCHAGPIRVGLAWGIGLPLDRIYSLGTNFCSVNVLEFPHDEPTRVTLLNG